MSERIVAVKETAIAFGGKMPEAGHEAAMGVSRKLKIEIVLGKVFERRIRAVLE